MENVLRPTAVVISNVVFAAVSPTVTKIKHCEYRRRFPVRTSAVMTVARVFDGGYRRGGRGAKWVTTRRV